jgi:CTP-dependent riboflavin kinase
MPFPIRRIIDAAQDTKLPGSAINLFTAIALRASDEGEAVVTFREMADELHASVPTVSRGFIALEQSGYVRRKKLHRVGESTTITILPRTVA